MIPWELKIVTHILELMKLIFDINGRTEVDIPYVRTTDLDPVGKT